MRVNYGMPYKGSKSKIAKDIIAVLPPARHFYDVFGGGGAMAHCALRSGKYQIVHYNEPRKVVCEGFEMACSGQFKGEDRWISREDFSRFKDSDPYVACCFSFANDFGTYLYSRTIEPLKRALHYAIAYDDWSLLADLQLPLKIPALQETVRDITELRLRRLRITALFRHLSELRRLWLSRRLSGQNLEGLGRLQSLEYLERLHTLENRQSLKRLEITSVSYEDMTFEPDSVIYCDPPYEGTVCCQYGVPDFDFPAFYRWAKQQTGVFISETNPKDGFRTVWQKELTAKVSAIKSGTRKELLLALDRENKEPDK